MTSKPGAVELGTPGKGGTASGPSRLWVLEMLLINLCSIMWNADNNLLPAVYFELSRHFGASPSQLGLLALARGLSESVFAFPSGFLADRLPRPLVICVGCLLWAGGLVGCGLAPDFAWLVAFRALNGVGLGLVQPLLFSLVADKTSTKRRGLAFGTLQFTGNVGNTAFCALATGIAARTIVGLYGWQFVFFTVALLSALTGVAILLCVEEPNSTGTERPSMVSIIRKQVPAMGGIICTPTFLVIIMQGIFGTAPWFAFSFVIMWLELSCFTHGQAALIYTFFGIGQAIAGLVGGKLLDVIFRRFPDHGPPFMAQFTILVSVPLLAVITYALREIEAGGVALTVFCLVFLGTGTVISWGQIINNKIFSDIVPQDLFSYVYALDRSIEGFIGAFATPIVGLVTDKVFHYSHEAADSGECSPHDATSLGNGLFSVCAVAFTLCFAFYSLAHCTYPKDRRRFALKGKGGSSDFASEASRDMENIVETF